MNADDPPIAADESGWKSLSCRHQSHAEQFDCPIDDVDAAPSVRTSTQVALSAAIGGSSAFIGVHRFAPRVARKP
jgi:hypothetical protein